MPLKNDRDRLVDVFELYIQQKTLRVCIVQLRNPFAARVVAVIKTDETINLFGSI